MAVTPTDIKNRYPEFADIPDARIQIFIDDAVVCVNEQRAGIYYDKLISLLTAHMLALALQTEQGINKGTGMVGSMSEGDTSISFSSPSSTSTADYYYQQTAYGIEYLSYRNILGGGGLIV